jgi:hypothetical protein
MSDPRWPQQPNVFPQPGAPQAPAGAPAQSAPQPFAATQAMDLSQGQFQALTPGAQPPQQGPWSAQPAQQGAPFAQPAQPAWGQPPQQPAWGQPPQQPPWAQPPQQPPWAQPQQPAWGQPSTAYAAPPARPASANGASALGMLAAAALVLVGVGAKVALRTGGRSIARTTSSSPQRPLLPIGARAARAATPDELLQDKLSPYVEHCLNLFSREVNRAEGRYFEWVDRRKGPTGRERIVYGMPDVARDPAQCQRAVASAASMAPSAPDLEAAGARFAEATAALVPIIRQVHAYYVDPTVYRGDNMARGVLLHPQLVSALEGYTAAHRDLSDTVSRYQDQATDGFLNRVRNDPGRVVDYNLKNDQRMARHLARSIRAWQVDRRGVLSGIDAAQFAPAVTEYQLGVASLSGASTQNPSQALAVRGLPLYQARSAAYARQLQGLSQRLQSGQTFTRPELRLIGLRLGWTLQGSPDAAIRAYEELVQSYNSLR